MSVYQMSAEEIAIRQRLKDDFEHYAQKCLRIRRKTGAIEPLILNRAQRHLHSEIEDQLRRTGRVRKVVLKGRQQGCSTYIGGRYFWKVTHRTGQLAYIITHESAATDNLYDITERYYNNCPPQVRPSLGEANAKEFNFAGMESGYKVATAGTKEVGRSATPQFVHASEVGFWRFADDHASGLLQGVPDADGTEVILESTANGIGNYYHKVVQDAQAGIGDYEFIFLPWYWQEEYRRRVDADFRLDPEEMEYMESIPGMTKEQMNWRRFKIIELKDPERFKREYPRTPAEAFEASSAEGLIKPRFVMIARRCKIADPYGPLIMGVDCGWKQDRAAIGRRRGRKVFPVEVFNNCSPMQLAGIVAMRIDAELPAKCFIDLGSHGAGTYDRLIELGYGHVVVGINFGGTAIEEHRFSNKRAEMWGLLQEAIEAQPFELPDSDTLHADLTGPQHTYDSNSRLVMETKKHMREVRKIKSPDEGDAVALTYAEPVAVPVAKPASQGRRPSHSWMG